MTSFKDLNQLKKDLKNGTVQIIGAEDRLKKDVESAIKELAQVWFTKQEYAKALIQAGVPDGEVIGRAETLAAEDHKGRAEACLALFSLHGGAIPRELKYIAHIVGAPLPKEAPPATQPAESDGVVNLHG